MANNNEALQPRFWQSAFEEIDKGMYDLHKQVSIKTELSGMAKGKSLTVPLPDDVTDAVDWNGESVVALQNQNQKTTEVILDQILTKKISLTATDLSMNPYDLMKTKALPLAEGMIQTLNKRIYREMLASPTFIDGRSTFNEDTVIDLKALLDDRKIALSNRRLAISTTDMTTLTKLPVFKNVDTSGSDEVQKTGFLTKKFGLDFSMNHAIERYVPSDILGNTNAVGTTGQTSIAVNNFTDSVQPLRAGDIFTIAGETGTPLHTVISTTRTPLVGGVTTNIVFSPPLASGVVANSIITVFPTRSLVAFTPSAIGLAMAVLMELPSGTGKNSSIVNIDGFPVRVTTWSDDSLSLIVQMDSLIGVKLVNPQRCARIIR